MAKGEFDKEWASKLAENDKDSYNYNQEKWLKDDKDTKLLKNHGFQWNSMDFHRFPWISMDFHGIP